MNNNKVTGGIILIGIGIILLLINLDIMSEAIILHFFRLWPILLIVIGVNVIFKKNKIVSVVTWVLLFAIIIGYGVVTNEQPQSLDSSIGGEIIIEKQKITEQGDLDLQIGGAEIVIGSTSSKLLKVMMKHEDLEYDTQYLNNNKKVDIDIDGMRRKRVYVFDDIENEYDIELNKEIEWNIDVNMGAVSGIIDLSELQINTFDLELGAGDIDMKFGDKNSLTEVNIDAGASNIDVYIPKNVGIKINSHGGLSHMDLKGGGWVRTQNNYYSPNYDEAQRKIVLDITMGVGQVSVNRGE